MDAASSRVSGLTSAPPTKWQVRWHTDPPARRIGGLSEGAGGGKGKGDRGMEMRSQIGPEGRGRPLIVALDQVDAGALPLVGGKAANLGELIAAGLPVPAGFCVTTEAYRDVV